MKHKLKMEHVFYLISLFLAIAKKLNLYQVLAPNAFSPVEEFVPILKKTVSSSLLEVSDGDPFFFFGFLGFVCFGVFYCYIFLIKIITL